MEQLDRDREGCKAQANCDSVFFLNNLQILSLFLCANTQVYQEIGLKDKQRYQSEMAEYKEKQRTNEVLTDVMPIQQIPVEPSIEMQNVNFKETDDADKLSEDGIDTIEEQSDEESELQVSPEAGAAAAESDMAAGPLAFENDIEMENKTSIPSSSDDDDDDEPERTIDTSPTKRATGSPQD